MRKRAALGGALASAGILLVGWQLGATATAGTGAGTTVTTASSDGVSAGGGTAGGDTSSAAPSIDGTYVGESIGTRFGSVQVQVTISEGAITDVTALSLTNSDGRSVQISNRAAPVLQQEVVQSQSANVANVSGATYTSTAYLSSVQSSLDQAGF